MITVTARMITPAKTAEQIKESREKRANDLHMVALKAADYHITEFYGGARKYAEMRDAHTMKIRDYSKKEYEALKAAGKTFKTDF